MGSDKIFHTSFMRSYKLWKIGIDIKTDYGFLKKVFEDTESFLKELRLVESAFEHKYHYKKGNDIYITYNIDNKNMYVHERLTDELLDCWNMWGYTYNEFYHYFEFLATDVLKIPINKTEFGNHWEDYVL